MTKPFDRAHSIYGEIRVRVYGPLGSETPTCAEALTTAGLIAELQNRVEALEAAQRVIASPSSNRTRLGLTQDAPESSDLLVEEVVDAITDASAAYGTADEPARAAILAAADWLDRVDLHIAATRLRMEVG